MMELSMEAVQTSLQNTIIPENLAFSHQDAEMVSLWATRSTTAPRIVVDMTRARVATTSAFARLVLLRRSLLQAGRDIRLSNLHDQVASLYEIFRLADVLPSI
jgi:ABC-type transporter Mla MlaB component